MLLNSSAKNFRLWFVAFFFFSSSFSVADDIHNSIFGFICTVLSSGAKAAVSWEPQS